MTFEEFQNRARLFVIGALYPQELDTFTRARKEFGAKAEAFVRECQALHEAFALSMRPPDWRERLERRVMSIARQHAGG